MIHGEILNDEEKKAEAFKLRFELLKQEIDNLQNGIQSYDKMLITVKSWSLTVFTGLVLLTSQDKAIDRSYYLLLGLFITFMFWMLDGYFKGIQRVYTERYNKIEKYLQQDEFSNAVRMKEWGTFLFPDIGSGFITISNWERWRRSLEGMFLFNTYFFYLLMSIVGIFLLILSL